MFNPLKDKYRNYHRHDMVRCYVSEENEKYNDVPFKINKEGLNFRNFIGNKILTIKQFILTY